MKKIAFVLAVVMALGLFAACGSDKAPETTAPAAAEAPTDALTDLFAKLYEEVPVELPVGDMEVDLTNPDLMKTYLGTDAADGITEAQFSESMIGAQAFSISLVRCETAEAAETMAQTMFDNIDTRKWICVEASDKMAGSYGNLAVFIMVDPELGATAEQLMNGFATVFGGEIKTIK